MVATYFFDYQESAGADAIGEHVHFAQAEQAELEDALELARMLVEQIAENRNCRMCVTVYDGMIHPVARLWSAFEVDA